MVSNVERDYIQSVIVELQANLGSLHDPIFAQRMTAELFELLAGRNEQHNPTNEAFASFINTARVSGVTTETAFFVLVGVKVARLMNNYNQLQPADFSQVEDSWMDLLGYIILFLAYQRMRADEIYSDSTD